MSSHIPRSALIVLKFLTQSGPLPPKVISTEVNLPLRTVSFALRHLRKWNLCRRVPNLGDMRQPLYLADKEKAQAVFMKYSKIMS